MASNHLNGAGGAAHKMYDVRDGPGYLSTSVATREFQTAVQVHDVVRVVDGSGELEYCDGLTGVVISVSGQDDDEASDDVVDGMAKVWWMDLDEVSGRVKSTKNGKRDHGFVQLNNIADLVVVDRSFVRNEEVSPYPQHGEAPEDLQQGRIQDVEMHFKVQMLASGEEVWVHSTQFCRPEAFTPTGSAMLTATLCPNSSIASNSVGFVSQRDLRVDVVFRFRDGCHCVVTDASANTLLLDLIEEVDERVPFAQTMHSWFYPNQTIFSPNLFRQYGRYITGKWKKTHKAGTVVSIVPFAVCGKVVAATDETLRELVGVVWGTEGQGKKGEEEEEEEEEEDQQPAHNSNDYETASDYDDNTEFVEDGYIVALHPSLVQPVLAPDFHEMVRFAAAGLVDEEVVNRLGKSRAPAQDSDDAEGESEEEENEETPLPRRPQQRPQQTVSEEASRHLAKKKDPPASPSRYFPPRDGTGVVVGYDQMKLSYRKKSYIKKRLEVYKKALQNPVVCAQIDSTRRRSAVVTEVETKVRVAWQDGSVSDWLPAKELFTLHHIQEFEFFPGDIVVPIAKSLLTTVRKKKCVHNTSQVGMLASCYDMRAAIDRWSFVYGDFVLYCPRTADMMREMVMEAPLTASTAEITMAVAPGTTIPGLDLTQAPTKGGGVLVDHWTCSRCTLHNPLHRKMCTACEGLQPKEVAALVKAARLGVRSLGHQEQQQQQEEQQVIHLFGCAGLELLPPLPASPAETCVGVVQAVSAKQKVARVMWSTSDAEPLPPQKVQQGDEGGKEDGKVSPPHPDADMTALPVQRWSYPTSNVKGGVKVGVVVGVSPGGLRIEWHRHATSDEGVQDKSPAFPYKNGEEVPFSELLVLDVDKESDEEDDDDDDSYPDSEMEHEAGRQVARAADQPVDTSSQRTWKFLSWGKDLMTSMSNMFRSGTASSSSSISAPLIKQTAKEGEEEDEKEEDAGKEGNESTGVRKGAEEQGADEKEEEEEEEPERFTVIDEFKEHQYLTEPSGAVDVKRIQKEWSTFHKNLPAGIKVVASESQLQLLQGLIEGPTHTPYRNCIYVFQLFLPPRFPVSPPKAKINSYGLRLNPNLYANGHICLSLLGTWDGYMDCEQWSPSSTLLQVFISIQGLVLTKEPYYNEAGYHNHLGTAEGRQNSRAYNEQVYLLSLRYLTTLLESPPKHLKDDILRFVKRNWKGTVERAEVYALSVSDADDPLFAERLEKEREKERDMQEEQQPQQQKQPLDKRMVSPQEVEEASKAANTFLNEDGLILPVSVGFAVSLKTSVLPALQEALRKNGFAVEENPPFPASANVA